MSNALIILSGGQDSTTCAWAANRDYDNIYALTFDYGQRHQREIQSARDVASLVPNIVHYEVLKLPDHIFKSKSPLVTHSAEVGQYESEQALPDGIGKTFVEGRNLLFLALAANRAAYWDCSVIYIGVSQEDFGGYPDCREKFLNDTENAINQALGRQLDKMIVIKAPLLFKTKKQTVEFAAQLGNLMGEDEQALAYESFAKSHTCYKGVYPPCLRCHACILRSKGFREADMADPLTVEAFKNDDVPRHVMLWGALSE